MFQMRIVNGTNVFLLYSSFMNKLIFLYKAHVYDFINIIYTWYYNSCLRYKIII